MIVELSRRRPVAEVLDHLGRGIGTAAPAASIWYAQGSALPDIADIVQRMRAPDSDRGGR